MRSVFDELEGLLGKDEIAKIKANSGLSRRLEKNDELFSLYDDEVGDDPPARRTESRTDDDPPARREATGDQTLADLTKTLQGITAKLGDVPTKKDLEETITKRGEELAKTLRGQILAQADELNIIHRRNEKEFGEPLDSEAFQTWANEQMAAGRNFAGHKTADGKPIGPVTKAWEEFTASKREEARVDQKVREKLKERATANQGTMVPGVTPPSSKSPIAIFSKRGRDTDAGGGTAVDRAGAALESALSARASEA